jgi:hypothetical protein
MFSLTFLYILTVHLFAFLDPTNPSQQRASQFVVRMEQHMEVDFLGTTSG